MGPSDEAMAFADFLIEQLPLMRRVGVDRYALAYAIMEYAPSAGEGDAESLARAFHDAYERLAPNFGYETRRETRAFDQTTPNGRLMIAVCGEMLRRLATPTPQSGEACNCQCHRNPNVKHALPCCEAAPASPQGVSTMEDAIAAGDGTLHGAIDYWQERAEELIKALRDLRSFEYQRGDLIHQSSLGSRCMCAACIEQRADAALSDAAGAAPEGCEHD